MEGKLWGNQALVGPVCNMSDNGNHCVFVRVHLHSLNLPLYMIDSPPWVMMVVIVESECKSQHTCTTRHDTTRTQMSHLHVAAYLQLISGLLYLLGIVDYCIFLTKCSSRSP